MDILNIIDGIFFNNFKMVGYDERVAAAVFLAFCTVCISLRLLLCVLYNLTRHGFNMFVKETAKKKSDPRRTKAILSPTMTKIIEEYVSIGEKGIAYIETRSIVENRLSKLGVWGISYLSLEEFVIKAETAAAVIGLALALIYNSYTGFGILSIVFYMAFRIAALFFNFTLIRKQLESDIISYVDREVGQHYISDAAGAVGKLRVELVVAISNIGTYVEKAMEKVENTFSANIKAAMDEIANNVNFTMESLSKYTEYMDIPFNSWKEAVDKAAAVQNDTKNLLSEFFESMSKSTDIQRDMTVNFKDFIRISEANISSFRDIAGKLEKAADTFSDKYSDIDGINKTLMTQIETFMKNQRLLEASVENYENSLKEITADLSGGMGAIVKHHMEQAYTELNEGLRDSISLIASSNSHLILKIESLLDEMSKKSNIINN